MFVKICYQMPNAVYLVPENSRPIDDVGRGMGSDAVREGDWPMGC